MSIPRLLDSAKGQMSFRSDSGSVHVNNSRFQIALRSECVVHVACVDGSGKAVFYSVGNVQRLIESFKGNHGNHGAKNLFLTDAHRGVAFDEDGWFVKPATSIIAFFQTTTACG